MQESWKNTNDLNEALGDDFDVAAGWEAFNKPKKKERLIPFWFWGALSVIGLAIMVCFCLHQNKKGINPTVAKNNPQLLKNDNPITNISTLNSATNRLPQKEALKPAINPIAIAPFAPKNTSQKSQKIQQYYAIKNSAILSKKSSPLNSRNNQFTLNTVTETALINEHLVITKNKVNIEQTTEKNTQNFVQSLSLKSPNIRFLPTLLKPLVIDQKINMPTPSANFTSSKTIPIPPTQTWAFGLTYTYNQPKRVINGQENSYQNLRQNGEQFLEQQQIDFTLTKSFNHLFFLSIGLTYGRYRSRLIEKIQTLQSPIVYNDVIIATHTQNNITNEIKGTAIGSQLSINQSTRYQMYQTLAIPVQLGVNIPLKKDWQCSLSTGIALNLWQQTKGNTYASSVPDGKFISVASLGYRSAGTLENISTFQLQKKITKQLSLQLGIQTKFDLTNRMKKEMGVSDKWKSYGLSIGISKAW